MQSMGGRTQSTSQSSKSHCQSFAGVYPALWYVTQNPTSKFHGYSAQDFEKNRRSDNRRTNDSEKQNNSKKGRPLPHLSLQSPEYLRQEREERVKSSMDADIVIKRWPYFDWLSFLLVGWGYCWTCIARHTLFGWYGGAYIAFTDACELKKLCERKEEGGNGYINHPRQSISPNAYKSMSTKTQEMSRWEEERMQCPSLEMPAQVVHCNA